jgi:hypothetical protein
MSAKWPRCGYGLYEMTRARGCARQALGDCPVSRMKKRVK